MFCWCARLYVCLLVAPFSPRSVPPWRKKPSSELVLQARAWRIRAREPEARSSKSPPLPSCQQVQWIPLMHKIPSFINTTLSRLYLLHYFSAKIKPKKYSLPNPTRFSMLRKEWFIISSLWIAKWFEEKVWVLKKMFAKMGRHIGYHRCYLEWDGVDDLVWVTWRPGFWLETAEVLACAGIGKARWSIRPVSYKDRVAVSSCLTQNVKPLGLYEAVTWLEPAWASLKVIRLAGKGQGVALCSLG